MNECDTGFLAARRARIEIIPLIDVIFFLLATFVLFTLSLQKIKSLDVMLPSSATMVEKEDSTVYIQASDEGTFYWKRGSDGVAELITTRELAPRLQDYRRHAEAPRVLIRADRTAKFGAGVVVLDEVRKAGIAQVSVETNAVATGR